MSLHLCPISPEVHQARVEFVASQTRLGSWYLASELVRAAGDLAITDPVPDTVVRTHPDPEVDRTNELTHDTYTARLTGMNAYERKAVKTVASSIRAYEEFRPLIDNIAEDTATKIGEGQETEVYKLEHSGESYAVRLTKDERSDEDGIFADFFGLEMLCGGADNRRAYLGAKRASTIALATDIRGTERLVAHSAEDGVCITKYIPGVPGHKISDELVQQVTPEHIGRFVHALGQLSSRGLRLDYGPDLDNPSNVMWSPGEGFTALDLQPVQRQEIWHALEDSLTLMMKLLICEPESFTRGYPEESATRRRAARPLIVELQKQADKVLDVDSPADTLDQIYRRQAQNNWVRAESARHWDNLG